MKETITINKKKYNLNVTRAKELGVLSEVKPIVTYSVGQRFNQAFGNKTYLLASIAKDAQGTTIVLIDIEDGYRWSAPVVAQDGRKITAEELKLVMGNDPDFTLITN